VTTTELAITTRLSLPGVLEPIVIEYHVLEPIVIEYHYRFVALIGSDMTINSDRWIITVGS
jgi:hypothetical protein